MEVEEVTAKMQVDQSHHLQYLAEEVEVEEEEVQEKHHLLILYTMMMWRHLLKQQIKEF